MEIGKLFGKVALVLILAALVVVSCGEYEIVTLGYGGSYKPSYGGGYTYTPPPPPPPPPNATSKDFANNLFSQAVLNSGKTGVNSQTELNAQAVNKGGNRLAQNYRQTDNRSSNGITFDANCSRGQSVKGYTLEFPDGTSSSDLNRARTIASQYSNNPAQANRAIAAAGINVKYSEKIFTADSSGNMVSKDGASYDNVELYAVQVDGSKPAQLPVPVTTTFEGPKVSQSYNPPAPNPPSPPYQYQVPSPKVDIKRTDKPDVPVTEKVTKTEQKQNLNKIEHIQSGLNPSIRTEIYDKDEDTGLYDVKRDVPTNENLSFKGTADQAVYDIEIKDNVIKVGYNVKVSSWAEFKELHEYVAEEIYLDNKLAKSTNSYYYRYGNKAVNKDVKVEWEYTLSDIQKAAVWPLSESHVYAAQVNSEGEFVIKAEDGTDLKIPGIVIDTSKVENKSMGISVSTPKPLTKSQLEYKQLDPSHANGVFTNEAKAKKAAEDGLADAVKKAKAIMYKNLKDAIHVTQKDIKFEFYGLTVESHYNDYYDDDTKAPTASTKIEGEIKIPQETRVLDGRIPAIHPNGTYEGKGLFVYRNDSLETKTHEFFVNKDPKTYPVPNNVIVLSPVHDVTTIIPSSNTLDQRMNKTAGSTVVQLDEDFTLVVDLIGVHKDVQAYSPGGVNKDTTHWTDKVLVKFPFDVYEHKKDGSYKFIKGGTKVEHNKDEFTIDADGKVRFTYTVPVWAEEASHTVETEVKAINYNEKRTGSNTRANTSETQYVAKNTVKVDVVGKIYDLRVNNSTDLDWLGNVQSMGYSVGYVPANEFPFGNTRRSATTKSQNKNAAYTNAPKLGYTFAFNFKSKGRKTDVIDIDISEDGFYFVSKATGQVQKVDLYVKNGNSSTWLKVGKENNLSRIEITPNAPFLQVDPLEMANSTRIYPLEGRVGTPYNYSVKVPAGTLANLTLPHNLRMCYDNFAEYAGENGLYKRTRDQIAQDAANSATKFNPNETGSDRVLGSVGHWYAGYTLPAQTVAVKEGTPEPQAQQAIQTNDPSIAYKSGYIMVGMNIQGRSKKNANAAPTQGIMSPSASDPYLEYTGPKALDANGKEVNSNTPAIAWGANYEYDPNNPATYQLKDLQGINTKVKVPNNVIAIFDADVSNVVDNSTVLAH